MCEGRDTHSDHAGNDLVLRRSTDAGTTWEEMHVIAEDGDDVLINPTAVVLESGRVLLMFQHFPAGYHARAIGDDVERLSPGITGDTISRTLLVHSDDDGQTWSSPRDVTEGTKRPEGIVSTATGPGRGIVLQRGKHAGRIVMPTNESFWDSGRRRFNVYACYSDDQGESWQYGRPAPNGSDGFGNEVQMVERTDGTILLNSRSFRGNSRRKTAVSADGGVTWSPLVDDPALIEPECQGTIIRYSDSRTEERSLLLFANPASTKERQNGTVRLSYDQGRTWPVARTIYEGPFAYSCLTVLSDHSIGLLYERDGYRTVTFARFTLDWLTSGSGK
jgi:sialidase-1